MSTKPVLLGYQAVRIGSDENDIVNGRTALEKFARVEGYSLGEVFIDRDVIRPGSALVALITAAKRLERGAVAVRRITDLGSQPHAQETMKRLVEREAGVRVLIAERGA